MTDPAVSLQLARAAKALERTEDQVRDVVFHCSRCQKRYELDEIAWKRYGGRDVPICPSPHHRETALEVVTW